MARVCICIRITSTLHVKTSRLIQKCRNAACRKPQGYSKAKYDGYGYRATRRHGGFPLVPFLLPLHATPDLHQPAPENHLPSTHFARNDLTSSNTNSHKKESPYHILSMISWIKVMTKTVRRLLIIIPRLAVRVTISGRKCGKIALVVR